MRAVSAERLIREISSHHFAVLATSATNDAPHSAGVSTASTHLYGEPAVLGLSQTAEPQLEQRPARSDTLEPHERQRSTPVASVRVLRRLS